MGHYKSNSPDSRHFTLKTNNLSIGELRYNNWYSFKAEIILADNSVYQLEPKGFWDSKIELRKGEETLLVFQMGWKGIAITTQLGADEKKYLLKLRGLFSSKYVLVDTQEKELLSVDTDLKWNKLTIDFDIETSNQFDGFENKELLLFTVLHCINYNLAVTAAGM